MALESTNLPDWDLSKPIEPYKGIRVNGTDIKPFFGFRDYWGKLYCKPWYTIEEAQKAADARKALDDAQL